MKKLLTFTAIAISTLTGWGGSLHAAEIAEQSCDPQYWRQLSSRAWLEAEREIMQNQNLIFKPDSVMQYTCFDQSLNISAWKGGDIFVHTDYFGRKIIQRNTARSMQQGIGEVVFNPMLKYLENFGHDFLGGRAGKMEAESAKFEPEKIDNTSGDDDTPSGDDDTPSIDYNCQNMSKIWKAAKCANFIDNDKFERTDGFYPFESLQPTSGGAKVEGYNELKEMRALPNSCKPEEINKAGVEVRGWQQNIDRAKLREELYKFKSPLGEIFKEVIDRTEPGECSKYPQAIKTGITVVKTGGETHPDGVCTNPGCTYDSGGQCS